MRRKMMIYLKFTAILSICVLTAVLILYYFGEYMANAMTVYLKLDVSDILKNEVETKGFESDFMMCVTPTQKNELEVENISQSEPKAQVVSVNLSALSGKYANYKGTSVINNTDYDVTELLYQKYKMPSENNSDEPYILIYHTHTSEGYSDGGSVVDVGREMKNEFEKLGYKTIHITEAFDSGQFSGSYSRSAEGVKKALEKYPSIKLVFDIHRDSITDSSGVEYRPLTQVDGKSTAQVMFVCGTDEKGLEHPNWRENFKFALDVSRNAGTMYGALSRPVNLRGDRFNTHFTNHSFLIEVGSAVNTLEEAKNAAVCTAKAIIGTIEKS